MQRSGGILLAGVGAAWCVAFAVLVPSVVDEPLAASTQIALLSPAAVGVIAWIALYVMGFHNAKGGRILSIGAISLLGGLAVLSSASVGIFLYPAVALFVLSYKRIASTHAAPRREIA